MKVVVFRNLLIAMLATCFIKSMICKKKSNPTKFQSYDCLAGQEESYAYTEMVKKCIMN